MTEELSMLERLKVRVEDEYPLEISLTDQLAILLL
jgi:hypothetical protein